MSKQEEFINSVLGRITFNPSTRFEYVDGELVVYNKYFDTCAGSGEATEYAYYSPRKLDLTGVARGDALKIVVDWVYEAVILSEVHEISEKFKVDGTAVFFPHMANTEVKVEPPTYFVKEEHIATLKDSWGFR